MGSLSKEEDVKDKSLETRHFEGTGVKFVLKFTFEGLTISWTHTVSVIRAHWIKVKIFA